jgi:hypothetical protein
MSKSTVVPFDLPSEFSPDPLTEVIQAGAKELLRTAIQAGRPPAFGAPRVPAGARSYDRDRHGACASAARA